MTATTVLADLLPETPTFLDDLTPESGLALRRWTTDEYHRMDYPRIFGPDERTELINGEVMVFGEGVPRLFTRDEYCRLGKYGILKPEERTELIYGRIITRMIALGEPHNICVLKTFEALLDAFGRGYAVRPQMSMRLRNGAQPQPDVAVVPGRPDDNADIPFAADAVLIVEVSDTSLRYDRHSKATMYANEGVADYWLINLRTRALEVRRQPEGGEYLSLNVYAEGEAVAPLAAPDVPIRVSDLLPLRRPE